MDKQDKLESGVYLFSQPASFESAFPTIDSLKVEVETRKDGPMQGVPLVSHFGMSRPPGEYIRCPRSSCTDGGWCIGDALRDMVANGEISRKTGGICSGRERMNRTMFRKCLTHFMAEITLTYKE